MEIIMEISLLQIQIVSLIIILTTICNNKIPYSITIE